MNKRMLPLWRQTSVGLAAAFTLAISAAPASAAAGGPTVISPQLVAGYETDATDGLTLRWFSNWLLRADGGFGYLTQRYATPIDGPTELFSLYGSAEPGQLHKQAVDGVLGGVDPGLGYATSGIGGYDWYFQTTQATHTLLAIDDRARVSLRISLGPEGQVFPRALVATGSGLRVILRVDTSDGLEVWRENGSKLAEVPQLEAMRAAVGRADGSVLLAGFGQLRGPATWSKSLFRVSPRGGVSRVRDGRHQLVFGDPVAVVRDDVLLATPGTYPYEQISLFTRGSQVAHRTNLSDLDLPWSDRCVADKDGVSLSWADSGPSGLPMVGLECYREGDSDNVPLEALTVGLDRRLRARWVVAGGDRPVRGADGRLYSMNDRSQLLAWSEPGADEPQRGQVVSVRATGGGAVVTIRCRARNGSVCAGTAYLHRGSTASEGVPYALHGRPGKSAAAIRRHFEAAPTGAGRLRATLGR